MNKRAAVTGGAGFIGSHMTEYLVKKGWEVLVIDNLLTEGIERIRGLINDRKIKFKIAVEDEDFKNVDVIFHFGAIVGVARVIKDPMTTIKNNVLTTINLVDQCRFYNKLFFASSSEVYGINQRVNEPIKETAPKIIGNSKRWCYATGKLVEEQYITAAKGLKSVIGRLFGVVGPGQSRESGHVFPNFIKAAIMGRPLFVYGNGDQMRSFCWVGDVVESIYRLMEAEGAYGQVFNIGRPCNISIMGLAKRIKEVLNSNSDIHPVEYQSIYGEGSEDMSRSFPNVLKLSETIGFYPMTVLEDAIVMTAKYYKHRLTQ